MCCVPPHTDPLCEEPFISEKKIKNITDSPKKKSVSQWNRYVNEMEFMHNTLTQFEMEKTTNVAVEIRTSHSQSDTKSEQSPLL